MNKFTGSKITATGRWLMYVSCFTIFCTYYSFICMDKIYINIPSPKSDVLGLVGARGRTLLSNYAMASCSTTRIRATNKDVYS